MKCPNCDGKGKTTEYDGLRNFWCDYKCEMCNGTGEVMTEQEYIQTCNTEQLAEEIYGFVWCSNELWQRLCCSGDGTDKESDLKIVREWLKQPHQ